MSNLSAATIAALRASQQIGFRYFTRTKDSPPIWLQICHDLSRATDKAVGISCLKNGLLITTGNERITVVKATAEIILNIAADNEFMPHEIGIEGELLKACIQDNELDPFKTFLPHKGLNVCSAGLPLQNKDENSGHFGIIKIVPCHFPSAKGELVRHPFSATQVFDKSTTDSFENAKQAALSYLGISCNTQLRDVALVWSIYYHNDDPFEGMKGDSGGGAMALAIAMALRNLSPVRLAELTQIKQSMLTETFISASINENGKLGVVDNKALEHKVTYFSNAIEKNK